MKKLLFFALSILVLFSAVITVSATEITTSEEVIYFEDGSYLVIETIQAATRSSNSTSGFKRITYNSENGNACWIAILAGTFTYDGSTAVCTTSSATTTVYVSNWYEISKSASKISNAAMGTIIMGRTVLGFTVAEETYNMTLTCSPDGTLS